MSFTDKAKNKAQELTGAAKERLRGQGATEQSEARARQAGQRAKEPGRDVRGSFTR